MRNTNCELVRRELDELKIGEAVSAAAVEHLRECAACREFNEKQTKLRQIVGSLGTVAAPPDFDFRLRARLANESNSAVYHFSPASFLFGRRGLAVAATLLLFATGAVLVRNVLNRPGPINSVARHEQPAVEQPSQRVESNGPTREMNPPSSVVADNADRRPQTIKNERPVTAAYKPRRSVTAVDFSSERADLINGTEPVGVSAAFPIDASSVQSLKVSVDDGRGNARTISVPTISFGSQRLVRDANQFAPKRDW